MLTVFMLWCGGGGGYREEPVNGFWLGKLDHGLHAIKRGYLRPLLPIAH